MARIPCYSPRSGAVANPPEAFVPAESSHADNSPIKRQTRFTFEALGTRAMPITLLCPRLSCRAILRVPDNVRGQRVRCSECGTAFLVPDKGQKATFPAPTKPTEEKHAK